MGKADEGERHKNVFNGGLKGNSLRPFAAIIDKLKKIGTLNKNSTILKVRYL